jgi:serine protease AprX
MRVLENKKTNDLENVFKCIPGWPTVEDYQIEEDRIFIPTSHRTSAEEYEKGVFSYQFTGQGGLSWSIPYLAGVLALGREINPKLSNVQIVEMVFDSAYVSDTGANIINPPAFIEMVKSTVSQ